MNIPAFYYDEVITRALKEDINYYDLTTDNLIPENQESDAVFLAKSDGILCGITAAKRTFALLGGIQSFEQFKEDGDSLKEGDIIARAHGRTQILLKGERTALNIIQHMSGISTAAHRAVEIVKGTRAAVTDTRKTLPGLRSLEKYAVTVGGGKNHRYNLSDAALIKDNHIDAVGSISQSVETLRAKAGHTVKIEVETRTLDEVRQAVAARADIIMLDNMDCEMMKTAVQIIGGRALVEASGGITAENLCQVAETGVDIISIGALTHSVKALDISMKIR